MTSRRRDVSSRTACSRLERSIGCSFESTTPTCGSRRPAARQGLVTDERWERFQARRSRYDRNRSIVEAAVVSSVNGGRIPAPRALKQPEIRLSNLVDAGELTLDIDVAARDIDLASLETDFKYEGYIQRQHAAVERQRRQEGRTIPAGFQFAGIPGLSREMVERLSAIRPETLGQASRISGVTPAAISVIAAYLDRPRSRAAV